MRRQRWLLAAVYAVTCGAAVFAEGTPERIVDEVDQVINTATDRGIDTTIPEADEGARAIARSAARAVGNPFSDAGFDDIEDSVEQYFTTPAASGRRTAAGAGGASLGRAIRSSVERTTHAGSPPPDARSDQVYLKDGQRLVGTLSLERISFRASFGLAALPVADVDVLILGDDAHYLELRNGDRLTGAVSSRGSSQ